jgi:hypothetical protein
MLRYSLLLFIICISTFVARGQSVQNGFVFENKTRVVLQGIRVENSSNNKYVVTDKAGKFSIEAKTGDLLIFKGLFYVPDTVLLTNLHDREIFLTSKQTMLNEVKVVNTEATHLGSVTDPAYHGQTVVYHLDKNKNYDGGAVIRVPYWKKDEKKRKREAEFLKNQELQDEITKVFSADNIAKYVPLKGADLDNFILLYIPTVKTYTSKDFDLPIYLNTSYKKFLTLSPDERNAGQLIK